MGITINVQVRTNLILPQTMMFCIPSYLFTPMKRALHIQMADYSPYLQREEPESYNAAAQSWTSQLFDQFLPAIPPFPPIHLLTFLLLRRSSCISK